MAFVAGGAPGTAQWSFASEAREDRIDVVGTDGRVSGSTFGDEPIEILVRGDLQRVSLPNARVIQQPLIQTIVDTLESRGECPSTGVSAARTSAVIDRVLAPFYGTREGDFWREPLRWPGRRAL